MFPCRKEAQICVVGKVFRPNKSKVLALNKTLSEYFKIEVVSGLQFQIEEVFA